MPDALPSNFTFQIWHLTYIYVMQLLIELNECGTLADWLGDEALH